MDELIYLGRSISIAYRMANRFYDRALARWGIGCGQQFFLLRIYENRGSSVYDLARMGLFDKGTATRAVQKLEELGYVRSEADGSDKRVRRLYPTELAEPVVQAAYDARRRWIALLTRGMTRRRRRRPGGCSSASLKTPYWRWRGKSGTAPAAESRFVPREPSKIDGP